MAISTRHLAWLLTLPAVVVGCREQTSPAGPEVAERSTASRPVADRLVTFPAPLANAELERLSPRMRAVMRRTVAAALVKADLQPDASMSALQEFFQEVEAPRAREARHPSIGGEPCIDHGADEAITRWRIQGASLWSS